MDALIGLNEPSQHPERFKGLPYQNTIMDMHSIILKKRMQVYSLHFLIFSSVTFSLPFIFPILRSFFYDKVNFSSMIGLFGLLSKGKGGYISLAFDDAGLVEASFGVLGLV